MASDGVLFKVLARVHPRFQTPLIATLIAGTFGGKKTLQIKSKNNEFNNKCINFHLCTKV